MLTASHVLSIISLLPLSFALLLNPDTGAPAKGWTNFDRRDVPDTRGPLPARHLAWRGAPSVRDTGGARWFPRSTPHRGQKERRGTHPPDLLTTGIEVSLLPRHCTSLNKRASNGSIIPFGTSLSTYIVPVSLGSPPVTYPLQLDIASSDLLLASTLCGSNCPTSLGTAVNPYYDVSRGSAGFVEVDGNDTRWSVSFADGTVAGGFVARETVLFGNATVEGQVFGLINSTNLTLSSQQISGILGLGFPRLSSLARVLLSSTTSSLTSAISSTSSEAISTASASFTYPAAAAPASSTSGAAYLPPLLESLVRSPHIPYPVFGLALVAPPVNLSSSATSTSTSSSTSSSSSVRYALSKGSLTLGGISGQYVSTDPDSGRTVGDIEWWDVVPFGRPVSETSTSVSSSATASSTALLVSSIGASSAVATSSSAAKKKRSDSSQLDTLPTTLVELEGEEYIYWALSLSSISVNGTLIAPNATYASLDVPAVALLDVGTNGIYGPAQDVERMFELVSDARQVQEGRWAVPCDTKMTIGFSFGGRYVQLQPSDWMYAQVAGSSFCLAWPVATAPTGDGIDWQLGTPFLKNVYSVFSYGINGEQAPLVGFLPIPDSITPSSSTSTSTDVSSTTSSAVSASASSRTITSSNPSSSSSSPNPAAPTQIDPLSLSQTITTTLPNQLLPSPSFSIPSYIFTTPAPSLGATQYLGLANGSAYAVSEVPVDTLGNASVVVTVLGTGSGSAAGDSTKTGGADKSAFVPGLVGQLETAMAVVGAGFLFHFGAGWL